MFVRVRFYLWIMLSAAALSLYDYSEWWVVELIGVMLMVTAMNGAYDTGRRDEREKVTGL